jgi:hypothetical protein
MKRIILRKSSTDIIRIIQVKKDEMGGSCSTNGVEQECI